MKSYKVTRRLRAVAICAALWLGSSIGAPEAKEPMSQAEFSAHMAKQMEAQLSGSKVEIKDGLTLHVTTPSDMDLQIFLDNDYRAYRAEPEALSGVVADRIASMREVLAGPEAVRSPDRILPVVRDLEFLQAMESQISARYPHRVLNDYLVVLYVFDSEHSMQYVVEEDLKSLNVPSESLLDLAVANLSRHLTGVEVTAGDGLYILAGADSYESSLILLEQIWT